MKFAVEILLVFAVFSTFIPFQELYELVQKDTIEQNCCSGNLPNEENHDTCTPLCRCFNNMSLNSISSPSLSLEVKFIHYHTDTNKFNEEQTESIFRPPIA